MLARSIRRGDLASAAKLIAQHGRRAAHRESPAGPSAVTLAQACGGHELRVTTPAGQAACYLIRRTLAEVSDEAPAVEREYAAVLRGARQQFDELAASPGLCHAADARPEDLLLIRIEAGRSDKEMVFLVGLLAYAEGRFVFEQLLAREEAEEAAVLQAFADRRDAAGVLVTFSGRAGHLKRIQRRCELHGIEPPYRPPPHLELRDEVRRQWRGRLPAFTLRAVRTHLLRHAPSPGAPAAGHPAALRHFIQTADPAGLGDILHHNRLDLLSMAQLVCLLLTGCDPLT